ncbi:MAG TPA: DUF1289 domain-containing protein [Cellvibrionaceae bacterium]
MIPIKPITDNSIVASPCVRHCCLDSDDLCVGCGRYLTEIIGWTQFSPEQKKGVVNRARQRVEKLRILRN